MEVTATDPKCKDTVLLYGHLDKQPPLTESWDEGLGPYTPVLKDGKLFGRGSADDGYAIFAAISSILALQQQNIPHARCVIVIEACEESGSPDLPAYVEFLEQKIATPSLIVCLDSGCGNYDQFWLTTSLRGIVVGNLKVSILEQGAHSGHASGIVPDSFRIIRQLLSRIEDEKTGKVIPKEFYCDIPEERLKQTKLSADTLGKHISDEFPFVKGARSVSEDLVELLLNRNWRPTLTITGVEGIPTLAQGGNVLRTHTTLKLSLRVPPRTKAEDAGGVLKSLLVKDPPYGANVTMELEKSGSGWDSPQLSKWLEDSVNNASKQYYNKPANFIGEGGSIPFMGMLGEKFPQAQFVITGVLGPQSNAHGPNEFLHIDMGKRLTCCVSQVLADHYSHFK